MKDLRDNVKINYLYRDAGNYKQFGYEVLTNCDGTAIEDIKLRLNSLLIDGEFFVPTDWGFKNLPQNPFDPQLDHLWHEIDCIEETKEAPTIKNDIASILSRRI